jgi:1-deoxy-D-xylulose-5-phosphate synthase
VRILLKGSEGFFKGLFVPGLIFHELGFRYIGPVSGHDVKSLVRYVENIIHLPGPILFHVVTKKGQGYGPAEKNPTQFHGTGAFNKDTGRIMMKKKQKSYTEIFGDTILRIAGERSDIIAITAGMTNGTGLDRFAQLLPDRFYDVGIAEQHAVTFAAGMAVEGLRPVVAIYSTFLQRAYDQVLHDVCMQNLPVVFMLDRAGVVGEDGPTHHGLYDISYLRNIPNLILMSPKDENELQHMIYTALQLSQPVAIRYPRGSGQGVVMDENFKVLPVGKSEIIKTGENIVIFGIGSTVYPALQAAEKLEEDGMECEVVNARFIKPVDEHTLFGYARNGYAIMTVEENQVQGGFGSAILETLSAENLHPAVTCLGYPDQFVEHGDQAFLRHKYGIDSQGIIATVKNLPQQDSD